MPRLLITLSSIAILVAGCGGQPPVATYPMPGSGIAPMPLAQQTPTKQAEPPSSAEALSHTTSAYAQSIETQLDKRAIKPQTADGSPKPVEKLISSVQWLEPKEFRLHLAPPQSAEGPDKLDNPSTAAKQPQNSVTIGPRPDAAVGVAEFSRSTPPSLRENPATSDELLSKLSQAVKDDPKSLPAHLDLQLLHLLLGHATPQMDAIAPLAADDRELIAAVLDGFNNFRAASRAEFSGILAKKIRPLVEMADRLRAQADLHIANIALCTRVDGFGNYEPLTHFLAGREYQVILYCEVENFSSHLNANRQWETNLTQESILYNTAGQRVWDDRRRAIADTCRNRRRDFFVVKMIRIPPLAAGQYSLKVSITDPQSNRGAQATIPLQIVER
ncbi:MAG TPA: hypothetical protein VGQ99_00270 [Tepidisphaeraceae bacterium]|jgi:hypothetical protein|nr:hypothetical protein [Tepidisphaeraceae bacterium]